MTFSWQLRIWIHNTSISKKDVSSYLKFIALSAGIIYFVSSHRATPPELESGHQQIISHGDNTGSSSGTTTDTTKTDTTVSSQPGVDDKVGSGKSNNPVVSTEPQKEQPDTKSQDGNTVLFIKFGTPLTNFLSRTN